MVNAAVISTQLAYLRASGIIEAFNAVAKRSGLDRSLLLAIASRESHMGMNLDANWLGDNGNGIGIMQIDRRYHKSYANAKAPDDHLSNVLKAAEILSKDLKTFSGNKKQALAAYNAGTGSVRQAIIQGLDPDLYTTGQDYGKDVLNRYEIIRSLTGDKQKDIAIKVMIGTTALMAISGTVYYTTKASRK